MQDSARPARKRNTGRATDYMLALAKGDALTPEERQKIIDQYARYTGLDQQIDRQREFAHRCRDSSRTICCWIRSCAWADWMGASPAPDPEGLLDTAFLRSDQFGDPAAVYLGVQQLRAHRTRLQGRTCRTKSSPGTSRHFRSGSGATRTKAFPTPRPDCARRMVKNPYLKVLVMEGYYDLATPYVCGELLDRSSRPGTGVSQEHFVRDL